MKYDVLFVDWDGTLSNSRFWDRWIGTDRYDAVQKALFDEARDLVNGWMTGFVSRGEVLEFLVARTGIGYAELEEELMHSAKNMEFIDSGLVDIVGKLQAKGLKLVIATDNMDTFRHWTIPTLKLDELFDGILVSDSRGALKGEAYDDGTSKFFHHYLSQNGQDPSRTVLIDNSPDAKRVEDFGMNFLHVNDEKSLQDHLRSILSDLS